jgi:hypothetical protein
MKNILTTLAAAAIIIAALPSCKKVTPRKLDGKWKVTKGSVSETDENPSRSTKTTLTYDGTTETGTETTTYSTGGNPDVNQINRQLTVTYEFVKDDDTYTITSTETGTETDLDVGGYYIKDANGSYVPFSTIGQLDIKTSYTQTTTTKGIFSITGGAGDIKKNSQIVMQETSNTTDKTSTIKYFIGSSEYTSTLYNADFVNGAFVYTAAPSTETSKTNSTSETAFGIVVTVDELKGGVMDISFVINDTYTSGAYTSKSTGDYKYTLEQE